jgi:hypothetical protein
MSCNPSDCVSLSLGHATGRFTSVPPIVTIASSSFRSPGPEERVPWARRDIAENIVSRSLLRVEFANRGRSNGRQQPTSAATISIKAQTTSSVFPPTGSCQWCFCLTTKAYLLPWRSRYPGTLEPSESRSRVYALTVPAATALPSISKRKKACN